MSKQYVITLTAGHSNVDSGAVTKTSDDKVVKEADLAVKLRNAILHYLQQDKEIVTRTDGYGSVNLPLTEAIKLIKGSDAAVEVHFNASSNPQANGTECIGLPKDKALAQALSKAVVSVTGGKLRGDQGFITQEQSARGTLGYVRNGGLILEISFISNKQELETFEAKYWLIAKEIAQVLINYVKNKK